ncbi:hypothetical protein DYB32_008027 [Aphanomyces invadans]|uniref:Uncharacterized protein n=1 Tax=Aphanomyces invadans TaxID=157072 RepID=A0A418AME9_9STRA|nr:hypothetical protein DYB32_008027 [Aphanomyces invadans]
MADFVGVDVDVPTVEGLRFFVEGGQLVVDCTNFTGKFALSKPVAVEPRPQMPSPVMATADAYSTPVAPKFAGAKKRAVSLVETPIMVYEDVKRQKLDQIISPDDKLHQPSLSKAMQFLESEKENIYGSEDELELLLTQREASVPVKKPQPVVETKRAPLKQLDVPDDDVNSRTKKQPKAHSAKRIKKAAKTKHATLTTSNPPTAKLNFFAPKDPVAAPSTPRTQDTMDVDVPSTPDSVVDVSPSSPVAANRPNMHIPGGEWKILEPTGVPPSQRWGCTATMISNHRVVVYGGEGDDESTLADLFVYDVTKAEWSCPLNCESIPRSFHASVYVAAKNLMLVFGGERVVDGSHECLSDLMVLDTGQQQERSSD